MGTYEVWLYFEDNSPMRNYYWGCPTSSAKKTDPFKHYLSPKMPSVESADGKIRVKSQVYAKDCNPEGISLITKDKGKSSKEIKAGMQYVDGGIWKDLKFSDGSLQKEMTQDTSDKKIFYMDFESLSSENFAKACANYTYTNDMYPTWNWQMPMKSTIFYPDYVKKLGTAQEITCQSKNCIVGSNGIQIYCDQPTLVHTMYCTKKLSATNTAQDAVEWESSAQETGLKVYRPSSATSYTYLNSNYDSIPSGSWYTTIVHFADGDIVMGEVRQK
jgi:hypothetical protein